MHQLRFLCFVALIAAGAHAQTPIGFQASSPLFVCEAGVGPCQYSINFTGGTPPPNEFRPRYTFTTNFAVPGMVLVRGSGDFVQIDGTPITAGNYTFNLTVSDGQGGQ